MKEAARTPETNYSDTPEAGETNPDRAAVWLIEHQASVVKPQLKYELNIADGNNATVEIEDKPESEFDRRHELLDNSASEEEVRLKPMVSLGQVLADHPKTQSFKNTSDEAAQKSRSLDSFLRTSSTYKKAVLAGLLIGVAVAATTIGFIIKY